MRRRAAAALLLAGAPLTAGRPASAAGYYVPDTGTVARSRGGAFVARADDPLALVWNPAGFAEQRRVQVLADVSLLRLEERFTRSGVPADAESGSVAENDPPPQVIPALVYSHPFGDALTLAAGLVAPTGPRFAFPSGGPQRFTTRRLLLTEATYGAAIAFRAHPRVTLGFLAGGILAGVEQELMLTMASTAGSPPQPPPSEAPALDLPARLSVEDPFTPTVQVGVKVFPRDGVELGFSYRPEASIDAKGTFVTGEPSPSTEDVRFRFVLPVIWRGGIRFARDRWDAELDLVHEGWDRYDEEVLVAEDGNFAGSAQAHTRRDFRAAWSIRLGGTFSATPVLRVHAGTYWETGAVPARTMDVSTYDAGKLGLAAGVSVEATKTLTLSMNVTHTFVRPVRVTDSTVRQRSPFGPEVTPEEALSVVGNGRYSGAYDMAGLALLAQF